MNSHHRSLYYFFLVLIVSALVSRLTAFPTGAPLCFGTSYNSDYPTFLANHGSPNSADPKANGGYSIRLNQNAHAGNLYAPGCPYSLAVCGPTGKQVEGVLLLSKGLDSSSDFDGYFSFRPGSTAASQMQTMACDANYINSNGAHSGAVTHNSKNPKSFPLEMLWTAPADINALTLHLFIVVDSPSNWYHVQFDMGMAHEFMGAPCPALLSPDPNICANTQNNLVNVTGGSSMSSMMMAMPPNMFSYFTTNQWKGQSIFFSSWTLSSSREYFATILCVVLLAFIWEFLSAIQVKYEIQIERQKQKRKKIEQKQFLLQNINNGERNEGTSNSKLHSFSYSSKKLSYSLVQQLIRTLLYSLKTFLSMLLMILFMTMDVGLFIGVLSGYILGFFCFSWTVERDNYGEEEEDENENDLEARYTMEKIARKVSERGNCH